MKEKLEELINIYGTLANLHYDFYKGKMKIELQEEKTKIEIDGIRKSHIHRKKDYLLSKEQKIQINVFEVLKQQFLCHKKQKDFNIKIEVGNYLTIQINATSILFNKNGLIR